jgi:hypothetical protein
VDGMEITLFPKDDHPNAWHRRSSEG